MIFLLIWAAGLGAGICATCFHSEVTGITAVSSNLLFWQLTVTVTLSGAIGFFGHVFRSDRIAAMIGWQKGSPFQKELGFAELGYALAGILCIRFHGTFWLATVVLVSPLFIGAACVHIMETVKKKNFNSGNVVSILPDFLIPATLITLSITAKLWM